MSEGAVLSASTSLRRPSDLYFWLKAAFSHSVQLRATSSSFVIFTGFDAIYPETYLTGTQFSHSITSLFFQL